MATLASFPLLFRVTDSDLAHTGSGGDVTDLGGDDIIFFADNAATCGGPSSCILAHEIQRYVNTTGELVAWVRIPYVNTNAATSDTVIYVRYGDATVTSPTENPAGVWDSDYAAVWHLDESGNGTLDEFTDSTSNSNHGQGGAGASGDTPAQVAGQISNGQDFDETTKFISISTSRTRLMSQGARCLPGSPWILRVPTTSSST